MSDRRLVYRYEKVFPAEACSFSVDDTIEKLNTLKETHAGKRLSVELLTEWHGDYERGDTLLVVSWEGLETDQEYLDRISKEKAKERKFEIIRQIKYLGKELFAIDEHASIEWER